MPNTHIDLPLKERELGAVLAGLRLYQMWLDGAIVIDDRKVTKHLERIAGGAGAPLAVSEVDTLCEHLNGA